MTTPTDGAIKIDRDIQYILMKYTSARDRKSLIGYWDNLHNDLVNLLRSRELAAVERFSERVKTVTATDPMWSYDWNADQLHEEIDGLLADIRKGGSDE